MLRWRRIWSEVINRRIGIRIKIRTTLFFFELLQTLLGFRQLLPEQLKLRGWLGRRTGLCLPRRFVAFMLFLSLVLLSLLRRRQSTPGDAPGANRTLHLTGP